MNILITGVSQGLGRSLSLGFSKQGHRVIGVSTNVDFVDSERKNGKDNLVYTEWDDINKLAVIIKHQLGNSKLDAVVNNAGMLQFEEFDKVNIESLALHYKVNAIHPTLLVLELFKLKVYSTKAHVVNISSMAGFQGSSKFSGLLSYSMSKAALVASTECLSAEFKDQVRFNCLCLGAFESEMFKRAFPDNFAPVTLETMTEFVQEFTLSAGKVMNGKIIPVNISNP